MRPPVNVTPGLDRMESSGDAATATDHLDRVCADPPVDPVQTVL